MQQGQLPFRYLVLVFCVGIASLGAGVLFWRAVITHPESAQASLLLLPKPRSFADFSLVDHRGKPFTKAQFEGHWSVLFFGFTACPDICPDTLFQFQQARHILMEELGETELPMFYLVSVDPERDTPQKLASYLSYFDPAFIGLSGTDAELRALATQLGIAYHVAEHEAGSLDYSVDHSSGVLLLNPDAQLVGVLPAPQEGTRMARDLLTVMP